MKLNSKSLYICAVIFAALTVIKFTAPEHSGMIREEIMNIIDGEDDYHKLITTMGEKIYSGELRDELVEAFSFSEETVETTPEPEPIPENTGYTETLSEELTYLGEPIDAFFHSSSGGKTENSENVWSASKPYLVSVESPGEEKIMSTFYSTEEITYEDLANKINKYKNKNLITTTSLKNKIKILSKTDGNRVKEIKIQDSTFTGAEIRNILGLRSANFNIELKNNSIVFNVSGYGHGVGMSQWGAEVMARNGSNYKEILYHYYPGTLIEKI